MPDLIPACESVGLPPTCRPTGWDRKTAEDRVFLLTGLELGADFLLLFPFLFRTDIHGPVSISMSGDTSRTVPSEVSVGEMYFWSDWAGEEVRDRTEEVGGLSSFRSTGTPGAPVRDKETVDWGRGCEVVVEASRFFFSTNNIFLALSLACLLAVFSFLVNLRLRTIVR